MRVASVAIKHVEINEIGPDKCVAFAAHKFFNRFLRCLSVASVIGFGDAAMSNDVFNFSDGIDRNIVINQVLGNE